ncbi:hypothetical protein D043_4096B, partial [Vibrio parahaemolyticus EKP-021]
SPNLFPDLTRLHILDAGKQTLSQVSNGCP